MSMRMHELADRSGLPKTTIHHYAREGLLPPAAKSAPNAALYGPEHLERLRLITRLRSQDMGELGIPAIRCVIEHVETGVDVAAAVRLVREGEEASPPEDGRWDDLESLAAAAAVPEAFARDLSDVGMIGRSGDGFGLEDYLVARAAYAACSSGSVTPRDLAPLADLLDEVGNYAGTLVRLLGGQGSGRDLRPALDGLCDTLLWRASRARSEPS